MGGLMQTAVQREREEEKGLYILVRVRRVVVYDVYD